MKGSLELVIFGGEKGREVSSRADYARVLWPGAVPKDEHRYVAWSQIAVVF